MSDHDLEPFHVTPDILQAGRAEEVSVKFSEPILVFVMGPTCSGKSTFLQAAKAHSPDGVGLVEVGKILRAKYPPEHFAGQNNPKHTADEAWDICLSEVDRHTREGKRIVLIDGQPRDRKQARLCAESWPRQLKQFILLDCDLAERERRARASRQGSDLEALAIPRLTNDMIAYYEVLVELLDYEIMPGILDTTGVEREECETLAKVFVDGVMQMLRLESSPSLCPSPAEDRPEPARQSE